MNKIKERLKMNKEYKMIPIKNIRIDDSLTYRDRWNENEKDGELLMSIINVGLVVPITVRPINNEETPYSLIDGYRRLSIAEKIGKNEVWCQIVEASDSEAMGMYLALNQFKPLSYEQIKEHVDLHRVILDYLKGEGHINDDEYKKKEAYLNNIRRKNIKPLRLQTNSTEPYYCTHYKCRHKQVRGDIFERHRPSAEGLR